MRRSPMRRPMTPAITPYDEFHFIHFLRLLDANAEGADWRESDG